LCFFQKHGFASFQILPFPSFIMSSQPQQEINARTSPIIQAKYLFSKGDVEGTFAVLKEGALSGNAMACFDAGLMMIQGIGCGKDLKGGLLLLKKGCEVVKGSKDDCWKGDGSVSELFEGLSMDLGGLLLCDDFG